MSVVTHKELLSRQQAAERLIDVAYALTAGGALELNVAGHRVTLPVAGELRVERGRTSNGGKVELELTWSTPDG